MADNTVTLVLDADQYYRELAKVTSGNEKLRSGFDRAGASVDGLRLKTEGRVAANIGGIVRAFTSGGSAADIFAEAVTRLSESFRGSLLFAGAAAAGVGLYQAIVKTGEAIVAIESKIADLRRPRGPAAFLGVDTLNKSLSDSTQALQEAITTQRLQSTFQAQMAGFGRFLVGGGTRGQQETRNEELRRAAQVAAKRDVDDLIDKTRALNKAEQDRLNVGALEADLATAEVAHKEKALLLAQAAVAAGLAGTKDAEELLAAENKRAELVTEGIRKEQTLRDQATQHESDLNDISISTLDTETKKIAALSTEVEHWQKLLELAKTFEEKSAAGAGVLKARSDLAAALRISPNAAQLTDPFRGLSPADKVAKYQQLESDARDKFVHSIDQARQDQARDIEQARQYGFATVGEYKDWQKEMGLVPNATTLEQLSGLDFSNMMGLSEMDFTGLRPLDGLTIRIQ